MARYNGRDYDMNEHVTLDGYVVRATTDLAVGVVKERLPLGQREVLTWIPRSCCDDGTQLSKGSTDIVVELWKADQEGLDY